MIPEDTNGNAAHEEQIRLTALNLAIAVAQSRAHIEEIKTDTVLADAKKFQEYIVGTDQKKEG